MTSRPVWLTREQRDRLNGVARLGGLPRTAGIAGEIMAAWDAAPADPAEAIATWFNGHFPGALDNQDLAEFAADVLRALGCPEVAS